MKKLLFVIYSLDSGGVPSSLSCLYNYMKDKDFDIRVFPLACEGANETSFRDVTMKGNRFLTAYYRTRLPNGIRSILEYFCIKCLKKLCKFLHLDMRNILYEIARGKIIREFNPEIVVAYQEGDNAKFVTSFTQKKKLAWIHFDYAYFVSKNCDESSVYSLYDRIVCVSQYTARTFLERYPMLTNKVSYIHNLLDSSRIIKLSQEQIVDDLFLTDRFTIISAGRISPEKRFTAIPTIARNLKEKGCLFTWFIIGREDKPDELTKLQKEIAANNVCDCVAWLGAKGNPYPYFKASHLYVSTSISEACPMVFNEARVLGIPIVSTDFGSSYEFVNDGVDGYISSIEEMPILLYKILSDERMYQQIKLGAKKFLLNETEVYQQIDKLFDIQ